MRPIQQVVSMLKDPRDLSGNYIIKMDSEYLPATNLGVSGVTLSTTDSTYWQIRVDSPSTNLGAHQQTSKTTISSYNGKAGTSNNSLTNTVGCKWGLTGGSGIYSYEIPSLDEYNTYYIMYTGTWSYLSAHDGSTGPINDYFAWDIQGIQSYISVNRGLSASTDYTEGPPDGSSAFFGTVNWYVNGTPQKTVYTDNSAKSFKIVWNKNDGMSYVYSSSGYTYSAAGSVLVGTYSITSATVSYKSPFCFTGIVWNTRALLYNLDIIEYGNRTISNYQVNGLSGSNSGAPYSPPPVSQLYSPLPY